MSLSIRVLTICTLFSSQVDDLPSFLLGPRQDADLPFFPSSVGEFHLKKSSSPPFSALAFPPSFPFGPLPLPVQVQFSVPQSPERTHPHEPTFLKNVRLSPKVRLLKVGAYEWLGFFHFFCHIMDF